MKRWSCVLLAMVAFTVSAKAAQSELSAFMYGPECDAAIQNLIAYLEWLQEKQQAEGLNLSHFVDLNVVPFK